MGLTPGHFRELEPPGLQVGFVQNGASRDPSGISPQQIQSGAKARGEVVWVDSG